MNRKLKAKIIMAFGTQTDFAIALGGTECKVSQVIRKRREISNAEKVKWAELLKCEISEIFGGV